MSPLVSRAFSLGMLIAGTLAATAFVRADEADKRFSAAAADYNNRQWKPATREFQAFLEAFPNDRRHSQAVLFLGESQLRLGQFREARRQYLRYLAAEPHDKLARAAAFRAAEAAFLGDDFATAEPELGGFLAKYPKDALNGYVLPYLGDIAAARNDPEKAAAFYRDALKRFPDGKLADDCRRRLALAEKKVPRTVPQPQEDGPEATYDRAWKALELGRREEADRLFEQLRRQDRQGPYWADATYRLAQRASDVKDFGRAAALVDELLSAKIEPGVREAAMSLRARIAADRGDWPSARAAAESLLRESPKTQWAAAAEFLIAEADYRHGDLPAADSRLKRLAEQARGARQEPWMGMAALRRAEIMARQGQWDDAYRLATAIEMDCPVFPQQFDADYLLGRCLAHRGDYDAARLRYEKAIRAGAGLSAATAAAAQWMIAESFFYQKNYDAAAREYLKLEALSAEPVWKAAALMEAGKCRESLGGRGEAVDLYRRVLRLYAGTAAAATAKKRMDALR